MSTYFSHYVIINLVYIQGFSNMTFLLFTGVIIIITLLMPNKTLRPTRFEILLRYVVKHWQKVHGEEAWRKHKMEEWFPLFCLFITIFILNILGFVIFSFPITAHFGMTIGLALIVWITVLFSSLYSHWPNLEGILLNFMPKGAPILMSPALILIEFISYCIRPLSLGLRLGANITAGHLLLGIIANFTFFFLLHLHPYCWLAPIMLLVSMILLEIVVLGVQAYVFVLLTSIYIKEGKEIH